MSNPRAPSRRTIHWRLAAVATGVALGTATGVIVTGQMQQKALRREVRWLRARLTDKHHQLARLRWEMAEIAGAVDRVTERAVVTREREDEARRLAGMDQSRPYEMTQASYVEMPESDTAIASEEAAYALEQLAWLESQTAAAGEAMGVLTALMRQPVPGQLGKVPSIRPVRGEVSSPFGTRYSPDGQGRRERHPGVDIRARYGTPVVVTADGEVSFAGADRGYGRVVIVDHGGGVSTLYAHLSAIYVREGRAVHAGEALGAVGTSGRATGSHLHYEVRVRGQAVDPAPYLVGAGRVRLAAAR